MTGPAAFNTTFTTSMELSPEAWRIMTGARACGECQTPIGLFTICEEDEDGWPIPDRPTGEKRWTEMADPPAFGTEHTPERCRSLREAQ